VSGANFDVKGESIDEERNQEESACEEEGCSEEKEVVTAALKFEFNHRPREIGAVFIFPIGVRPWNPLADAHRSIASLERR